ncbi:hypothetical protein NDU88_003272 [Pleurodeles waltl]|uniref:Reverse transcriptase domain-containing protein n=1 Tax=Pleurodeles waltl TaxID=8319 RepID=A0AAV7VFB1_PLEWA|nr:hypothetical protein NDU88_003272 [Pleurodeles waltl]KAJ1199437.1 hypothetical protein NDU88_003272 [Pleurodeles waltl]
MLPCQKAPGSDGFLPELYQSFPHTLMQRLLEVFLEAHGSGILPPTMREEEICMLLKSSGDESETAGYRPLKMINSDMKILCKVLASRVAIHMPYLVHKDQCDFIPDHCTGMNLWRLSGILSEVQYQEEEITLVAIDLEKAFVTVDWGYLLEVLRVMGFEP